MVVTAFAVDVAVGDLFVAGITHLHHLDLEVQALAGQNPITAMLDARYHKFRKIGAWQDTGQRLLGTADH